jgi:hypothetical protein
LGGGLATLARGAVQPLARHRTTELSPIAKSARSATSLLQDLRGARFGSCTVTDVAAVEHGSIPVTLIDSQGGSFAVDILRHDSASPGIARAGSLAVYLKVGQGQQATREEHGLAAMSLAAHLERREAAGAPAPSLLTLHERAAVRATWNRRGALARAS